MTRVLLDFIETVNWSNSFARQMRRNSIAETTMPCGVSPHRSNTRFASEPWFTPMRSATPRARHVSMSASNWPRSLR